MTTRMLPLAAVLAAALALAGAATPAVAGDDPQEATTMTRTARGDFEVKVAPVAQDDLPDGAAMGRYSLDKTYHGDLEATGKGEMLTAGTPVEGSAAYVAIEHVTGSLDGRKGSFILQHHGTMGHGEQHLRDHRRPRLGHRRAGRARRQPRDHHRRRQALLRPGVHAPRRLTSRPLSQADGSTR
jgi:hypothetical protein